MLRLLLLLLAAISARGIHLVEDEIYNEIESMLRGVVDGELKMASSSTRTKTQRTAYMAIVNGNLAIKMVKNVITGPFEERLVVQKGGKTLIYPRVGEVEEIIHHYYGSFPAEAAVKLYHRIKFSYHGISRKKIEVWLNASEEHGQAHPVFANKAPLQPVVSHTVGSK